VGISGIHGPVLMIMMSAAGTIVITLGSGPYILSLRATAQPVRNTDFHAACPMFIPKESTASLQVNRRDGPLELAKQLGNASQACNMMGESRDGFYRFKELMTKAANSH
jgi:hypothetical protein